MTQMLSPHNATTQALAYCLSCVHTFKAIHLSLSWGLLSEDFNFLVLSFGHYGKNYLVLVASRALQSVHVVVSLLERDMKKEVPHIQVHSDQGVNIIPLYKYSISFHVCIIKSFEI